LVQREVFPEVPARVEYTLTERGETLRPVLRSLFGWVDDHMA
jgi:DNA-binding HxlR family transcriptional regulator